MVVGAGVADLVTRVVGVEGGVVCRLPPKGLQVSSLPLQSRQHVSASSHAVGQHAVQGRWPAARSVLERACSGCWARKPGVLSGIQGRGTWGMQSVKPGKV